MQLAPELVERIAVEPPGAPLQPRRVDQVRRADLRHPHGQIRVLADEHARRARVVEMDVREQQALDVGEPYPRSASPAFSAGMHDVGPQSKSDSPPDVSNRYVPTVRAAPAWNRSIGCSDVAK